MVTRQDVADYAGVSKTTVTRVVNNSGYVSAENRAKVEEAIRVLGYRPNLIARSLKTKETRQILFFAPELTNPFYMEVYQGMEEYAREKGYTIVVSSHFDPGIVRQRQFDGIILSGIRKDEQQRFLEMGIPMVVTNYSGQTLEIPSVTIDMEQGARMAMQCLFDHGHERIGYLAHSTDEQDLRCVGYRASLRELGLVQEAKYAVRGHGGTSDYERGYSAGLEVLEASLDMTALFAFNDAMAIGAMAAFHERGVRIPEKLSIIGFDDILQSRYTYPPLTTIHVPKYEQGRESAKMLIKSFAGHALKDMMLQPSLIQRESVAPI